MGPRSTSRARSADVVVVPCSSITAASALSFFGVSGRSNPMRADQFAGGAGGNRGGRIVSNLHLPGRHFRYNSPGRSEAPIFEQSKTPMRRQHLVEAFHEMGEPQDFSFPCSGDCRPGVGLVNRAVLSPVLLQKYTECDDVGD